MLNIYKKIQNWVMAKISANNLHKEQTSNQQDIIFSKQEIVWLMNLIKEGTFRGSEVQTVYETVVKLQLMLNRKG